MALSECQFPANVIIRSMIRSNDFIGEKLTVTKHRWVCLCVYFCACVWLRDFVILDCYIAGIVGRIFTNGPGFNPRSSHTKNSKIVLDASLLNFQHYKVWTNGKWSNPWKGVVPSPLPRVVTIEKKAFRSPSTPVGQLIYSCSWKINLSLLPKL